MTLATSWDVIELAKRGLTTQWMTWQCYHAGRHWTEDTRVHVAVDDAASNIHLSVRYATSMTADDVASMIR